MIQRSIKRLSMRALVVDDELGAATAEGRAARALVQELQGRAIEVIEATSADDGQNACGVDAAKNGGLISAIRHSSPSATAICNPKPRTRTVASTAFGSAVPRLKRPSAGYVPRAKTLARESSTPFPLASKTPVKQIPFA